MKIFALLAGGMLMGLYWAVVVTTFALALLIVWSVIGIGAEWWARRWN